MASHPGRFGSAVIRIARWRRRGRAGMHPRRSLMQVLRTLYILPIALILTALTPARAAAQAVPGPCEPGALPSGALSLICVPTVGWNGNLVVFAHGYVDVREPLDFQNLTLPDGTS